MKRLIFGVLLAQFLFSCNNDLEIYSEKTDLPYVYGSITSNQSDHYIKVTKTFQKLAKEVVEEDLYFEDDSIQVYIDVFDGGNLIASHHALPVNTTNKIEGLFPSPTNKYYHVANTLLSPNTKHNYSIRVELPSGNVVNNLKSFELQNVIELKKPKLTSPTSVVEIDFESGVNDLAPYKFEWVQVGGAREQGILTVGIIETNTASNVIDTIYVPISVYNDIPVDKDAAAQLHLSDLLKGLGDKLDVNPDIERRILRTELADFGANIVVRSYGVGFEVWSESKDLSSYETIMFSQSGISQDKPNFTNLENGVGLYSTKSTQRIDVEAGKLFFGQRTLDSLACSKSVFDYNFAKSYIDNFGILRIDNSPQRCN